MPLLEYPRLMLLQMLCTFELFEDIVQMQTLIHQAWCEVCKSVFPEIFLLMLTLTLCNTLNSKIDQEGGFLRGISLVQLNGIQSAPPPSLDELPLFLVMERWSKIQHQHSHSQVRFCFIIVLFPSLRHLCGFPPGVPIILIFYLQNAEL